MNFSKYQPRLASVVRAIVGAVTAGLLLAGGAVPAQATTSDEVEFVDANLKGCVADTLSVPATDPINEGQLSGITSLICRDKGITDLSPLQHATGLTFLNLEGNKITDLTPVASLGKLAYLYLNRNSISNLPSLANLTSLTALQLNENSLTDVAMLSNLSKVSTLTLNSNKISNLAPLKEVTTLKSLHLAGNRISDVGALSELSLLTQLDLRQNPLQDAEPLQGLTKLLTLYISDTLLADVTPIASLSKLMSLRLSGNQISNLTPIKDLNALTDFSAAGQELGPVDILVGSSANIPQITSIDGSVIPNNELTISSGTGTVSGDTVTWTASGPSSLSWSREVAVGKTTAEFAGTIHYNVTSPVVKYTVSFDSNGGSAVSPIEVTADGVVSQPANPTKPGYKFEHWTLDQVPYDFSTPVKSDLTLVATWTKLVNPEQVPPTINPSSLPKGKVGVAYTATITATGAGKPVLSFKDGALPKGLKLDVKTGKVTGTPTHAATSRFTVKATDGDLSTEKSYTLVIEPDDVKPACSTPRPVPVFADSPLSHKFYKEIDWMECMKYSTGWRQPVGKPLYKPADNLERQAMAAFIYRMEAPKGYKAPAVSPFADVKPGDSFYKEMAWMHEKGYSTGWAEPSGKPTYRPHESLSREAMAAFIYRLEASKDPKVKSYKAPTVSPMADMKPGLKFYKEISWMYSTKLSTGNQVGTKKEYWPKDNLSRQAMAAFIYRLKVNYPK